MTKREGKEYLAWFLANRDRRASVLASYLGYTWSANSDELPALLVAAATGFSSIAHKTPLPSEYLESLKKAADTNLAPYIRKEDLSNETIAYCYDMAILVGLCFERSSPGLRVSIELGGKTNVDYGQIILLIPPRKVPVNPFRLCTVMARKVIDGADPVEVLDDLFQVYGFAPPGKNAQK